MSWSMAEWRGVKTKGETDYYKFEIYIRLSVTGFRSTDFFSEKIIVGPWEVPHPPFLEEIIVTH